MTCRLYGKNGHHGVLIDTNGNQCGLWLTSHAPCFMEMEELQPDEAKCPLVKMVCTQSELMRQAGLEQPAKQLEG